MKKKSFILFTYMQYVHGFHSSYPTIDRSEYHVDIWKREKKKWENAVDAERIENIPYKIKSDFNRVLSHFNCNVYQKRFLRQSFLFVVYVNEWKV
jgi:hypothetical protein